MEAYRWGTRGRAMVLRGWCLHCERAVTIDADPEPDDERAEVRAVWSCPYDDCQRPNLIGGVRDLQAVWTGHMDRPRLQPARRRRAG